MTAFTDGESRLDVTVNHTRDRTKVTLTGELDLCSAPPLAQLLNTAVGGSTKRVDVDMTRLGFADIAGVRVLLTARQLAAARGVVLNLCDPLPHIAWLMDTLTTMGESPNGGEPAGEAPVDSPADRDWRAEQADDRDRIAQERDRLVDERQQRVTEHQRWEDIREDLADTRERDLERREREGP